MSRPPTESWWDVACNISEVPSSSFMSSDWIPYESEFLWNRLMALKKEARHLNSLHDLTPVESFMLALFLHEADL